MTRWQGERRGRWRLNQTRQSSGSGAHVFCSQPRKATQMSGGTTPRTASLCPSLDCLPTKFFPQRVAGRINGVPETAFGPGLFAIPGSASNEWVSYYVQTGSMEVVLGLGGGHAVEAVSYFSERLGAGTAKKHADVFRFCFQTWKGNAIGGCGGRKTDYTVLSDTLPGGQGWREGRVTRPMLSNSFALREMRTKRDKRTTEHVRSQTVGPLDSEKGDAITTYGIQ
ncbi:uncharacterized protein SPSK_00896 [Sporothrix schenckii 1099-18]|uniref:Uncharacterized protein n=1 Tax=Sporothrix schenckii 1099-18 TaxID=1397361 RepID=A0A0F2LY96_SPOSC|nr:uncharacterized protein SPSK_00896 [Sporothrix schenckii 1099-18]KJR81829.1 hypothetical protein SPSK_00896 [Sporothrix schenckii 1099-18]